LMPRRRIRLPRRLLLQHPVQGRQEDSDHLRVVAPVVRRLHRLRLPALW
jgi:hypothetical protein